MKMQKKPDLGTHRSPRYILAEEAIFEIDGPFFSSKKTGHTEQSTMRQIIHFSWMQKHWIKGNEQNFEIFCISTYQLDMTAVFIPGSNKIDNKNNFTLCENKLSRISRNGRNK